MRIPPAAASAASKATAAQSGAASAGADPTKTHDARAARRRTRIERRRAHPWDEAPLRTKVTLLTLCAQVAGVLLGMLEANLNHRVWPLILGSVLILGLLMWLGDFWFIAPIERFVRQLDTLRRRARPGAAHHLPVARQDEVGRIARAFQQIFLNAIREQNEANRLRRTLDSRIDAETRKATAHLQRIAMRDPLTDLGNRRFFDDHLESLFESCRTTGADLVAVAIDLDNFKKVNDTLGHATGDELLVFLGGLLRASVRREDYAIRMGGDEFLLLMPDCPTDRVTTIVDRLVVLFRQHVHTAMPSDLNVGLSIGIASLSNEQVATGRALVERADANLYAAKRAGKNRAVGA
jgi:diguanylate cyclase (GGDEF)-like protein